MGTVSGEMIAKARNAKGLSAAELARQVGVTRGFISLLEKDATRISLDRVNRIADVLGVSCVDLGYEDAEKTYANPEWLKYLSGKFGLTDDDRRELMKIASRVGIPDNLPDETRKEFRARWEGFYQTVSIFLPNATTKMLRHSDVQSFIKKLNVAVDENATWDGVFSVFDKMIGEKVFVDGDMPDNGKDWLDIVCKSLRFYRESDCSQDDTDLFRRSDILAIRSFVRSSKRIYGAALRDATGSSYMYIENEGDKLFDRGDFPIWHEIVRVMVDPDLNIETGAYYYPDGEARPPLEFVICRLAARLACWPFRDKWLGLRGDVTPVAVQEFIKGVYPALPWRAAYVGLLDFCGAPYLYVDCYKRLKRNELGEKKIAMENVSAMSKDGDAKLRIGFVFRNLAAEETTFELRHNLRIPAMSTISKAMDSQSGVIIEGDDDLAEWDAGYDLKGRAKVSAVRQVGTFGEPHVRVVMKVK